MLLFLALHTGFTVVRAVEEALPGRLSPLPQELAPKCQLSKLEETISRFRTLGGHLQLLTLKQLQKKYPDEEFLPSPENSCQDVPAYRCKQLAAKGACNGTFTELEQVFQSSINATRFHEKTGWRLRSPEEVSPRQIEAMQVFCRPSCRAWMEGLDPEANISPELAHLGGYPDTIVDSFGEHYELCSLAHGMTLEAISRVQTLALSNIAQSVFMPHFHPVGFEKVAIPREMYSRILTGRKKALREKKWKLESCDPGMQNCALVVESKHAKESHLINREMYYYLGLDVKLQEDIYRDLRKRAQAWIKNSVELIGTSIYGIRKYTHGAKLMPHLDHMETHVISAILNIAQQVEEPWPLQILDHNGNHHNIYLKPGEMVWYESASLVHARSRPLNGSAFENLFVHYMPRSKLWYKTDWSIKFGMPDPLITIEDLQSADVALKAQEAVEEEERRLEEAKMDVVQRLSHNSKQYAFNEKVS